MTDAPTTRPCPVCDGAPRVLLVIAHPAMRRFTRALLEREFGCWIAAEARADDALAHAAVRDCPDLLVVDTSDYPGCCKSMLDHIPGPRVIVIGPEPDDSYRAAALMSGAGAWLPRDRVGDDLAAEMRRVLGCVHGPCPPTNSRRSDSPAGRGPGHGGRGGPSGPTGHHGRDARAHGWSHT